MVETVKLSPQEPLGAHLTEIDLRTATPADHRRLASALAEHGVLVAPNQFLDDEEFVTFLRGFGSLAFTAGERAVGGHPELNVVTNVGRTTPPVSNWHVDTAYVDEPPAFTALRAVDVPEAGGATMFCDQRRALETLPPRLRAQIEGRTLTHVVTGVHPGPDEQVAADHPLQRPHPSTGRRCLYLDAPSRCRSISGLDDDATERLITELMDWSTRPQMRWSHRWAPGDVVVWDNAAVMHRADHDGVVGDRTFHRGMVAADGHVPSAAAVLSRP